MSNETEHEKEEAQVEANTPPPARIVHATIARQGEEELARPRTSLFWSGAAASIALMASVSACGALQAALPDTPWRIAVVALGYPIGFLIVVLGRLQLFTEQTVIAFIPFARERTLAKFGQLMRLWVLVLLGNFTGAAAVSAFSAYGHTQSPEMLNGMIGYAHELQTRSALAILMRGVPAGFLLASVAWIRSASNDTGFSIVFVLTYVIALCGWTHVVAGADEAFLLMWTGHASLGWVVGGFLLPALIGNIIGGTGLFAVLAHAQVKDEI